MLMADTMAIFFVIVGLMLSFLGLWLLCRGLWPNMVNASAEICRRGLTRPFLIGLPFIATAFFVLTLLGKLGPVGKFLGVAFICLALIVANCGAAGLAAMIGERLGGGSGSDIAWRAILRGGIPLVLSFLPPIVGWFVILPFTLTIGLGAFLIFIFRRSINPSREAAGFSINKNVEETIGAGR